MSKLVIFLVCITFTAVHAHAQFETADTGSVAVFKDPRIDLLIKKQVQINEETTRDSRRNIPGFRIQLINTTDRAAAFDAKTRLYQLYPELKAYLLYQAPYYRLKVGNFKTRQEAEDYMSGLTSEFRNNTFIVRDVIEVRPETEITE